MSKSFIEKLMPKKIYDYLAKQLLVRWLFSPRPFLSIKYGLKILFDKQIDLSFKKRWSIIRRFIRIENNVVICHTFEEYLIPTYEILRMKKKGAIVETGSFGGGGTAKLSIVAKLTNRTLYVCDSFEGLPDNDEPRAVTTLGYEGDFNKGDYKGSLQEVQDAVNNYGESSNVKYIKGYYENTLKDFNDKIVLVFCDVDLKSSTETVLQYLFPQIVRNGYFFTQDAHIPIVNDFLSSFVKENNLRLVNYTKRLAYMRKR